MLEKLIGAVAAATATLLAVAAPVHPTLAAQRASLSVTTVRPFEAVPLYPGGPAATEDLLVRYSGPVAALVRLQVADFDAARYSAQPACRAQNPDSQFRLAVSTSKAQVYQEVLAEIPTEGVPIPGRQAGGYWAPGEEHPVSLAVSLARSADNSFMNCRVRAKFTWTAE